MTTSPRQSWGDPVRFEPGWLMRICHDAHIRTMCDHGPAFFKHLNLNAAPVSDGDAAELYEMMAARFKVWTGKDLSDFSREQRGAS